MAGCNGQDNLVHHLNTIFGHKLNIDVIRNVVEKCEFDANISSNELLEMTNTDQMVNTSPKYDISSSPQTPKKSKKAQELERIIQEINYGYKVLILMRGLPGSGKSTLAKSILRNTIGYSDEIASKHILSTDDFFMRRGVYEHDASKLSDAHGWNHKRAFMLLSKGYSPVIIDNTNSLMWEMKPYAMMATDFGYILKIVEPDTHWCFNAKELEKRNVHGVPKSSIQNMLDRYQKNITPMKLLTAYDCKYKLQKPPQYRLHPPLEQIPGQIYTVPINGLVKSTSESGLQSQTIPKLPQPIRAVSQRREHGNFMEFTDSSTSGSSGKLLKKHESKPEQSSSVDDILMHGDSSFLTTPVLEPVHAAKSKQNISLFDNISVWGVDELALRSWDIVTPLKEERNNFISPIIIDDDDEFEIVTSEMGTNTDEADFYVLRNVLTISPPKNVKIIDTCNRSINRQSTITPQKIQKKLMLDKSCLTEDYLDDHTAHIENLSHVFPNVAESTIKYWYKKCNYDFDCTMELFLSENDEFINVIIDETPMEIVSDSDNNAEVINVDSDCNSSGTETPPTTRKAKYKRKNNGSSSDEAENLKKVIESKINISDDHYSQQVLKVKKWRYQQTPPEVAIEPESPKLSSPPVLPEEIENCDSEKSFEEFEWVESSTKTENDDNVETIEFNLGEHFVKQLEDQFGDPNFIYPKGFLPIAQMPVALARQLYTFYIESVYQQMEVQNSVMDTLVKEDEEFARKLQEVEEKAMNVAAPQQISQTEPIELPDIMKEQRELNKWQVEADKWKEDTPDTLAARLTRDKLFKAFPSVDQNVIVEILHAHDNVYKDTVEILLASTQAQDRSDIKSIEEPPISKTIVKEMWVAHDSCVTDEDREKNACSALNYRDEANRFLERRTDFYQKAQRYFQSGMREVAQFYSGLASKQTKLFERANSMAATAFLDEHSKRLEDFNTLDLHFLYVKEAVPNLDIFLDRNINLLRLSTSKNSECLQIITGRGRNSINGIAKIKPAVLTRLNERNIGYQQLNAGLIRVKITKYSKMTCEL